MNNYFLINEGPDSLEPLIILELIKTIERNTKACWRLKNLFSQEQSKVVDSTTNNKRQEQLKAEIEALEKSIAIKNLIVYSYISAKLLIIIVPILIDLTRKIIRVTWPIFLKCKNYLGQVLSNTSQSIKLNTQIIYAKLNAKIKFLADKYKSPAQPPLYEDNRETMPPSYTAAIEDKWFKRQSVKVGKLYGKTCLAIKLSSSALIIRLKSIFSWKHSKTKEVKSVAPSLPMEQVEGLSKIYPDLYQSPKVLPSMMITPSAPDASIDLAHNEKTEEEFVTNVLDTKTTLSSAFTASATDSPSLINNYVRLAKQA